MRGNVDLPTRTYPTADAAFRGVLVDLAGDGTSKTGPTGTGAEKVRGATLEHINYSFRLEDMRSRIVASELLTLDLKSAVARFVWMVSGNSRLADISFYEPNAKPFTDDGVVMPGSSYGHRMRYPAPGVDQLKGVIERVRQDPGSSRRAAVSVYHPTDAVRESNDIPCLFGMFFHPRDGKLNYTVIMRSNNAFTLMPFNIFELTLMAEVVAAEANLDLGEMFYFAGSMHLYDKFEQKIVEGLPKAGNCRSSAMPAMPRDPTPLSEISKLITYEADLRHGSAAIEAHTVSEWIERARTDLHPYWQQFAFLLLASVVDRNKDRAAIEKVEAVLSKEWRDLVRWRTISTMAVSPTAPAPDLFTLAPASAPASVGENVVLLTRTRLATRFREIATDREASTGDRLEAATLLELQGRFFDRLAARGADDVITPEEFDEALNEVRGSRPRA